MKKIVKREIDVCDFCKEEEAWQYCRICGKYFCSNCEDNGVAKQLYSELGIESSGDVFCNDCILSNKYKDLFNLYKEMDEIRESRIRRYAEETKRSREITKKIREVRSLLVSLP